MARNLAEGEVVWAGREGKSQPFHLGEQLGTGHMGVVYSVEDGPGDLPMVVKIVHPDGRERCDEATRALLNVDPTPWYEPRTRRLRLCLPVARAFVDDLETPQAGPAAGYFMPDLVSGGMLPADRIFQRKFRITHPQLGWHTLVAAALSLSTTVARLHLAEWYVGDLALDNAFVDELSGSVTLIDVDSFSLPRGDGTRLPVLHFRPDNSPPEYLTGNADDAERGEHADRFALAVVIAQLLLEGHNPFVGTPLYNLDDGESIETANIRRGVDWINHPWLIKGRPERIPAHVLPLAVRPLFVRAFIEGHREPSVRPTAEEWRTALIAAYEQLAGCEVNVRHAYDRSSPVCPWCHWTAIHQRDPFPPSPAARPIDTIGPIASATTEPEREPPKSASQSAPLGIIVDQPKPRRHQLRTVTPPLPGRGHRLITRAPPAPPAPRGHAAVPPPLPRTHGRPTNGSPPYVRGCSRRTVEHLNSATRRGTANLGALTGLHDHLDLLCSGLAVPGVLPSSGLALSEIGAWLASVDGTNRRSLPLADDLRSRFAESPVVVVGDRLMPASAATARFPIAGCGNDARDCLDSVAIRYKIPVDGTSDRSEVIALLGLALAREPNQLPLSGLSLSEIGAWIAAHTPDKTGHPSRLRATLEQYLSGGHLAIDGTHLYGNQFP